MTQLAQPRFIRHNELSTHQVKKEANLLLGRLIRALDTLNRTKDNGPVDMALRTLLKTIQDI